MALRTGRPRARIVLPNGDEVRGWGEATARLGARSETTLRNRAWQDADRVWHIEAWHTSPARAKLGLPRSQGRAAYLLPNGERKVGLSAAAAALGVTKQRVSRRSRWDSSIEAWRVRETLPVGRPRKTKGETA